jgi:hypothetical protein
MAVKHAWMRSGKDIDLMGNQIYVMSDSGFVVYTLVDHLGTTVSAPCLDYRQEGYAPGEYMVYCETAAAQAGALRVAAAEYRADNTLAAVQCQDFSIPAGNSGLQFRFAAQGGARMKLLFWSDMLPQREAACFYP